MIIPNSLQSLPFWSLSKEDLLEKLSTKEEGISDLEAKSRLKTFGLNQLAQKNHSVLLDFLKQFANPLIIILFFASIISAISHQLTDFIIINSIIFISGMIDFYQQQKSSQAAEKLRQRVSLTANVIREGKLQTIPVTQLVPGDVIKLSAGNIIPADCRILEANDLNVNQSTLTGEAFPQVKNAAAKVPDKAALTDQLNCVFMGTSINSGEAQALVVKTGSLTQIGQISKQLVEKRPETEFQKDIKSFGILLMKITFSLVIFVFFINAFFKQELLQSFLFALALAVGLTPELLPLVITINLAKGATQMAKEGVIVKDLPSIQNFGSMQVLCTDKTGTLTEDHIRLERYENLNQEESREVLQFGYLNSLHQSGLKSPLDEAVLTHHEVSHEGYSKVDEIPFDFERKRLSVVLKHADKDILVTKGAPEAIFPICSHFLINGHNHPFSQTEKDKVLSRFKELSQQGFRVLAISTKQVDKKHNYSVHDESSMNLIGLMAFLDPTKESAQEALNHLAIQGIEVKILTGDNELVSQKICHDLNLPVKGVVIGSELNHIHNEGLINLVKNTTIFARVDPSQKQEIIQALKKANLVVGFMGDGINDAPSLRAADIGISVQNGVDVAKESADLILLHKDLNVLKDGVLLGRKTYSNIMKYIMMGTSSNFGNMFSVAAASIFLQFLPMLPTQILLNNLLYDLSQLAIPSDNVEKNLLLQPKRWNINGIKHFMILFGPISSVFDFLTFSVLLTVFKASSSLFQTGWFVESLITQVLIIFSIRTRTFPFFKSRPSNLLIFSALTVCLIGLILPFIPFAPSLSFIPLPFKFYAYLAGLTIVYIISVDLVKAHFFKNYEI